MADVRIILKGTQLKGRKGNPIAQISKWIEKGEEKAGNLSAKEIAVEMAKLARGYAYQSRSTGSLHDAIAWRKTSKTKYEVYLKKIRPWSTSGGTGEKASKVYPISQEYGYKAHWIHTSMIPKKVRHKFQDDWGADRFVKVKRFTPYMTPAYASMRKEGQKILNKEVKRLIKRSIRKGSVFTAPTLS